MQKLPPGSSLATNIAVGNELAQATGALSTQVQAGDPAMVGFGSGVHQYLNQLLVLIYSKTTTLLAASMVLISLLLSTRTSIKIDLDAFYIGSVFFFAIAAITSTIVLFPRMRHGDSGGLIFWRPILAQGSPEQYYKSIQFLTKEMIEEEYAKDNYHLSQTIELKDRLLRCAITFFILGLVCAVIGVVGPMVFSHH